MKTLILRTLATVLLAGTLLPALALYKVVQPDGSVTYTDRPPAAGSGRIITLGRSAAPAQPEAVFPLELRQPAQRYPVTLYTSPDCATCDSGRRLLQQRGIPFSERLVTSDADAAALERTVGARTVPALTIGAQALRGLSEIEWTAYLDAAGYPRESRLPSGWQPPAPTPLVGRVPVQPQAVEPVSPAGPAATDAPAVEPTAPGTLRF
ncbi:MAG: glutaredoxin family protein [Rubrivivax sp.]|nr:glutaredoxin family protein [Rubrivivax sp.]